MKRLFYILLVVATSTVLQAELVTEYFENGAIKSQINYVDGTRTTTKEGIKEGMEKIYHTTGGLAMEVNNTQGLRDGALRWYDTEGKLLEVMPYEKGKRHGLNRLFYENGNLRIETNYVNDQKEGLEKFYFSSGKLASEVNFVKDKKEGLQKEYTVDEVLASDVAYVHGYKEGLKRWYNTKHHIIRTEKYIMDRPVDTMKQIQERKPDEPIDALKGLDFNPNNKRAH